MTSIEEGYLPASPARDIRYGAGSCALTAGLDHGSSAEIVVQTLLCRIADIANASNVIVGSNSTGSPISVLATTSNHGIEFYPAAISALLGNQKSAIHLSANPLEGSPQLPDCGDGVAGISAFPLRTDSQQPHGFLGICFEVESWALLHENRKEKILELIHAVEKQLQAETETQRLQQFLSLAADWIWEQDADSLHFTRLFAADDLTTDLAASGQNQTPDDVMLHLMRAPEHQARHIAAIETGKPFRDIRYTVSLNGRSTSISIDGTPTFNEKGDIIGFRGIARDVTAEEVYRNKIGFLANHDTLTGLANRSAFKNRLKNMFAAWLEDGDRATYFHLDLDNFKTLNDTYGHAFGDEILKAVARRLETVASQEATIARLGGDEFAILDPALFRRSAIKECAQNIVDSLNEPIFIKGKKVQIGGSVGIAILPDDGASGEQLLNSADLALYDAKRAGRNRYRFFDASLRTRLEAKEHWRRSIGEAHRRDEIGINFLGIRDFASTDLIGAEAILAWHNTEDGTRRMRALQRTLAQTDEAYAIGEKFLRSACENMATWKQYAHAPQYVAVTLNPAFAADPDLARIVSKIAKETGISLSHLQLNIFSESLSNETDGLERNLRQLSINGAALGLADYGSLQASPFHCLSVGITRLNLDLTHLENLKHQSNIPHMGQALVSFARQLGFDVCISSYHKHLDREDLKDFGATTFSSRSIDCALDPDAFRLRHSLAGP